MRIVQGALISNIFTQATLNCLACVTAQSMYKTLSREKVQHAGKGRG